METVEWEKEEEGYGDANMGTEEWEQDGRGGKGGGVQAIARTGAVPRMLFLEKVLE